MEKKKQQVTLKRRVTISAIVTDKFKEFLRLELKETVAFSQQRIQEIDAQLQSQSLGLEIQTQLRAERQQLELTVQSESQQAEAIEKLENYTVFNQGAIDGFVSVSVGDNLYEKLGGMEIVVKDGIVQKLSPLPSVSSQTK